MVTAPPIPPPARGSLARFTDAPWTKGRRFGGEPVSGRAQIGDPWHGPTEVRDLR